MTKTIKLFSICAAIVLAAMGCTKEEPFNPYDKVPSVKIVSSDVLFDAAADQGTIVVEAESAFTAELDADWCSMSVSGNTITVSVTENGSVQGRSAVVVIKCGEDVVKTTVQQKGLVFSFGAGSSIITNNDEAHTLTYDFQSNVALNFKTEADWLSIDVKDGSMDVNIAKNATGHMRNAWLYYSSDTFADSLKVTQIDPVKDLTGLCYFGGYSTSTGKLTAVFCDTKEVTGSSIVLYDESDDWTIPFDLDPKTLTVKVRGGQYLGTYSSYYIYSVLWDGDAGYLTYATTVTMTGHLELEEDEDGYYTMCYFEADGSWTYSPNIFSFHAFTEQSATTANRKGNLMAFYYPFLEWDVPKN